MAIPSPSSSSAENKCSIFTSVLSSLLSSEAVSNTLFKSGVYKNKSVSFVPTPTIFISSVLNLSYVKSLTLLFPNATIYATTIITPNRIT